MSAVDGEERERVGRGEKGEARREEAGGGGGGAGGGVAGARGRTPPGNILISKIFAFVFKKRERSGGEARWRAQEGE